MPKVSVIIPVYGVEKYIERCARSLFEQTQDDIEYIFVDDCSPDKSIEILNRIIVEYPKRIKQTKIIHHECNMGLPIARQTGIKSAVGEYICHCDSDDWVDLDLYESLCQKAEKDKLDVVVYNYKTTDGMDGISSYYGGQLTERDDCINAMMHRKMWWSLCNKMFKSSIYNKSLKYPQFAMGEDMCLTLQLFYYCYKIGYVDRYYYYFVNADSIIQQVSEDKCLLKFHQLVNNVEIVKSFYNSFGLTDKFATGIRYLEYNAKFPLLPIIGKKQYLNLWRNTYKGCEWKVVLDNYTIVIERIKAIIIISGLYSLFKK